MNENNTTTQNMHENNGICSNWCNNTVRPYLSKIKSNILDGIFAFDEYICAVLLFATINSIKLNKYN